MTLPNESSSLTRGEKTKYRLAESMKECMCHTPVDAITVRQITENCSLTRQTFYRNFMDKFDLINWYFDKLLIKSFEYMGQGKTVQEGLQLKFSYIGEEMYCHGSISMTIEWVLSGMATSPEDLARLMVEAMPAKLADLFASFGILTE